MKHDAPRLSAPPPRPLRGGPPPGSVRFAPHEAAEPSADFSLLINIGAPCLISQGANELWLEEGGATLVPAADAGGIAHNPSGDVLALRFPREALGARANGIEDLCLRPIPRETPALGLLRAYVGAGRDEKTVADGSLQQLFVSHVHDLIALAIDAGRDSADTVPQGDLRATRLHAIKQDIERRLNEAELSVAALAQRHGCTPRFVQRLFEQEDTTFTSYVLAQRLARAHGLLSDPRRRAEKISEVALDCGFGDVSYFNRAFRRHYGTSPSDVRAQSSHDLVTSGRRDN